MELSQIHNFEKYYVSPQGDVYCYTDRWCGGKPQKEPSFHKLKAHVRPEGYCTVLLHSQDGDKRFYVHRLVAQAFIPNPDNLPCVNHKDENKQNNDVSNLEWCTVRYNLAYGTRHQRELETKSHPIIQFSLDGKFVGRYISASEAASQTKVDRSHLLNCCYGKSNVAGGFVWAFEDDIFSHIINTRTENSLPLRSYGWAELKR